MNKKTLKEEKYEHITHPFPPLYDADSKILILGSLPSVKSREQMFFYGHPQNRFWKVISAVLHESVPTTIEEKKTLGMTAEVLPSTSPANAAFGLEKLTAIWSEALQDY